MIRTREFAIAFAAVAMLAAPATAQDTPTDPPATAGATEKADQDKAAEAIESWKKGRPQTIQYLRAQDKRGLNVFETTKDPGVEFTGFKIDFFEYGIKRAEQLEKPLVPQQQKYEIELRRRGDDAQSRRVKARASPLSAMSR